jgi:hypothetical protein
MKSKTMLALLALALGFAATSCGGGGGGEDINISGNWTITLTYVSNTCGAPPPTQRVITDDVTITQSGSQFTLIDPSGTLTGTVHGSTITISGTISTTTTQGCNATVTYNGNGSGNETQISGTLTTNTVVTPAGGCVLAGQCGINFTLVMTKR